MNFIFHKIRKINDEWEVRRTGEKWHINLGKGLFRQILRCLMFKKRKGEIN